MATIYEVSQLAGVSLATVSRVMNGNDNVREKTKQKVLAAMKELDYRPSSVAQSLASNRTNSVGILVSELHGPFYGDMMSGIETKLRRHKKHTIIAAGHSQKKSEKEGIEFLVSRNCDALILHVEAVSDQYLKELAKNTPIVLINRIVPGLEEQCISLNNYMGGQQAAHSMVENGHQNIGYISGPLWKQDAKERLAGLQDILIQRGCPIADDHIYEGDYQEQGGFLGAKALLERYPQLSALVCANDEMAAGAMNAIREMGKSIPDDVSVFGFDNMLFAQYLFPKLSTIDYPIREMGKMAARLVLKEVYNIDSGKISRLFEPRCIERQSVNALPISEAI
ncbi:HTH-type transcriptional regulator GalR [Saliniradius amylolyticus]|uniref:HTH-type transcriptional regulator GalR n=1 Tax=Saliniradius amylolyticus TaxID=2183582 RepID=A0A2S2E153_9ALTE|nr:LacI family DNA-binding transcriptional regulator [Saliniradius amylolyticus]AWL11385.1 HTH-type transcriptional regulator GalR [Saliniradius amylolyticus]